MRGRGKALETYRRDLFAGANNFYSSASGLPCKKHPTSSPVGVCAYCLKDRLLKLVCSDCGEERLSSCSCSEISISSVSNRNSCSAEVGSVGRISFLIENEKPEMGANSKPIKNLLDKSEEVVVLKRSNSTCVDIKRSGGFWKIGKLFRRKGERSGGDGSSVAGGGCDDEKSEMCVVDYMGVSRSRSLCSFRGSNLYGSEDGAVPVSAARSSSFIGGMVVDSGRRSGFSEAEPRRSGYGYNSEAEPRKISLAYNSEAEPRTGSFSYNSEAEPRKSSFVDQEKKTGPAELDSGSNVPNRRIFSVKESDLSFDSGFIDLNINLSSSATEYFAVKTGGALSSVGSMRCVGQYENDRSIERDGVQRKGNAPCRITVNDRGMKKSRKSFKGWRWLFKNHPNSTTARKKDEDITSNPCYR